MSLAVPQIFDERRGLTNVNESNLRIRYGVAAALNSNCLASGQQQSRREKIQHGRS